jgi:CheY-like chemotaxis protein
MLADGVARSSPTVRAYVKALSKNTVLSCRVRRGEGLCRFLYRFTFNCHGVCLIRRARNFVLVLLVTVLAAASHGRAAETDEQPLQELFQTGRPFHPVKSEITYAGAARMARRPLSTEPMDRLETLSDTKDIPFSPPWQLSDLEEPARPKATELDARSAVARFAQIPIVVAEDDLVSRTLISGLMEKWGFKAVITQDGHEAMAALRAEQGPTIALLDWMMPGMDGLQVCRRVRESEKMVYVIMLTSLGAKENIVEGLHAGADDYLIKPFDKNELLARIQVGLRILELYAALAARVRELEKAAGEIGELKLRIPL